MEWWGGEADSGSQKVRWCAWFRMSGEEGKRGRGSGASGYGEQRWPCP